MENASNGTTNVKFNNRVITKAELYMLKVRVFFNFLFWITDYRFVGRCLTVLKTLQFARINHKGSPHYWVTQNGSYSEEGQNQIKGRIWETVRSRFNLSS